MKRPHRDSSVTRTASILRACASSRTRFCANRGVTGSRSGFLEDAEHLEAAALSEGGELGNLAFTGLVGGGDPGVDGGTLSQLNPLGGAVGNRLILLGR